MNKIVLSLCIYSNIIAFIALHFNLSYFNFLYIFRVRPFSFHIIAFSVEKYYLGVFQCVWCITCKILAKSCWRTCSYVYTAYFVNVARLLKETGYSPLEPRWYTVQECVKVHQSACFQSGQHQPHSPWNDLDRQRH